MIRRSTLKGVFYLLSLSVITALLYNQFSSSGIAFIGQWKTSEGVVSAMSKHDVVDPEREINDVTLMKLLVDRRQYIIGDVRSFEDFKNGHIPGAESLPIRRFDEIIGGFIEAYPENTQILLYCSGRECMDSHTFAQRLSEFGYTNVRIFTGGFSDWKNAGYPLEYEENDGN